MITVQGIETPYYYERITLDPGNKYNEKFCIDPAETNKACFNTQKDKYLLGDTKVTTNAKPNETKMTEFFSTYYRYSPKLFMKERTNTLLLFPIFKPTPIDNYSYMDDAIKKYYKWIFSVKRELEFFKFNEKGEPTIDEDNPSENTYAIAFINITDNDDDIVEKINRIKRFITINQTQYATSKFKYDRSITNVVFYTDIRREDLDKSADVMLFVDYYKRKQTVENQMRVSKLLKNNLLSLPKIGEETARLKYVLIDKPKQRPGSPFNDFVEGDFNNIYKAGLLRFRVTETADALEKTFRILYRVHSVDKEDLFGEIRTGDYIYKMIDSEENEGKFTRGKLTLVPGFIDKYIFTTYSTKEEEREIDPNTNYDKNKDAKDNGQKKYTLSIRKGWLGFNYVTYKTKGMPVTRGTIEYERYGNEYEKYKWFRFNDLDSHLTIDTSIKYYEDIVFDRAAILAFLQHKKTYNDKMRLSSEFLKINTNVKLMTEFTRFIYDNLSETHVDLTSFGITNTSFARRIREGLLDLLFTPNETIYVIQNVRKPTQEDQIKTANYKIVSYRDVVSEKKLDFDRIVVGDDPERFYCKKKKGSNENICDNVEVKIENNTNLQVIVLVTKENVKDVDDLKKGAECKMLKKNLQRNMRRVFYTRGGSFKRKKRLTRRRKKSQ
jgi:hypothetical protein